MKAREIDNPHNVQAEGGEGVQGPEADPVQAEELRRKALRDAYAIGDWDKVKEIQDADQADWEARQKVGKGSS